MKVKDGNMGKVVQFNADCLKFKGGFAEAVKALKEESDLSVFLDRVIPFAGEENAKRDLLRLWNCLKEEIDTSGATRAVFKWISQHCPESGNNPASSSLKRDKTIIETIDGRSPYKTLPGGKATVESRSHEQHTQMGTDQSRRGCNR